MQQSKLGKIFLKHKIQSDKISRRFFKSDVSFVNMSLNSKLGQTKSKKGQVVLNCRSECNRFQGFICCLIIYLLRKFT